MTLLSIAFMGAGLASFAIAYWAWHRRMLPSSLALEQLQEGVLVLDRQQRVVAINLAAEQIIGVQLGSALGQPVGRVLAAYPDLLQLCSANSQAHIEMSIGQLAAQRYYDVDCVPLLDRRHRFSGQMIRLQDVTQHKRNQDLQRFLANASTLLASSLDYEATLATVAQRVVPFLADWCIVYVRVTDQHIHCATSVAADPAIQQLTDELRQAGADTPASYMRLPRTGQSQLIAEVSDTHIQELAADTQQLAMLRTIGLRSLISVPLITHGRLLGTLLLATIGSGRRYGANDLVLAEDLAGRMALAVDNARLFEELHAAECAKSELLAHMSHEIRTPITGVLGMTDLLLETDLTAEQRDFIETIRVGGKALLAVVNGVLDFSKIEAGKLQLEQAPFDIQVCVEEAIDMVAVMAADKQLDLAYVFDPALPKRLIGDTTRLRQVLINLLSNAIKFTHQGDIFVSVIMEPLDHTHYQLRFSVVDTGIGIPGDRLRDIFTPFGQLSNTTYRRYGGTGLGLAISRRLVTLMGGQFRIESQAGVGSNFSFTISLVADPDAPSISQPPHPLLSGRRLLIVDQHRRSRQALVSYAEAAGMLPFATHSALEALAWIQRGQQFDVAVLDSDTHERSLASDSRYHNAQRLPLILLDTLGQRGLSHWKADDDYQALLHKPLRLSQLQAALINVLDGRVFHANLPPKRVTSAEWAEDNQSLRILLAEDNSINQHVIVHMLQKLGYQIEVVRDGDAALAAIEQHHYDVVLLDVQMPSKDGLEVAQTIRQHFPADRQPYLIAITANVMEGAREECLNAGMDDYISKPIQAAELMQAIEMHGLRAGSNVFKKARELGSDLPSVAAEIPLHIGQLLGEDKNWRLADLIVRFLDDTAELVNTMAEAAARADLLLVQRSAHRLKSSSALVSASQLSELCEQLEHALRMNIPIDVHEHIERITIEFARVKASLSA